LPSNTVTSTDLHIGGGGGTVANKHSGGGAGGGHRNNNSALAMPQEPQEPKKIPAPPLVISIINTEMSS